MLRKTFLKFLISNLILISALLLIGCDNSQSINDALLSEIKQDYIDCFHSDVSRITINDIEVNYFSGEYNGYIILMLSYKGEPFLQEVRKEKFDNIEIIYNNSNILRAWKNGEFYVLKELYNSGELSKKDIRDICAKFNLNC